MPIFKGLDRTHSAEVSAIRAARRAKPSQIYGDLVYLAGLGEDHLESRIGLRESAQLVLQIFKTAQSAKTHQSQCVDIAAQSYYLLNAVDGGVNGRAIDIDNILHSHVLQLNESVLGYSSMDIDVC
ncbi:hypothetical protein D9619_003727 [Psilocybe cf. subviscida]|uniref:Uncharacterized protein n=1 Tax=Psilocybe cf. subviscida TaxID=2480587 RepID=A0A8H5AYW4_9AGAR|nr:hypothetical protein D9619_003727 [Psilocybe cf. subviscida]